MSATTTSPVTPARAGMLNQVELLLRNRFRFFAEIRDGVDLNLKLRGLLLYSALFLAIFGAVIGSEHSALQAISSAIKLPLLFFITLLVCTPTLYFFNTIFEASLSVSQTAALLLSAIAMTAVVLLAFAPIVIFFQITSAQYQFFKLLNVVIFVIAGWIGVRQLGQGIRFITANDVRGARSRRRILWLWILLYAFVGSQLAWTLRPFFGAPGLPFELFRGLGGNFYTNIFASFGELFGFFTVH